MASKGQKFRKYSSELKEAILKEYFNGENGCESLSKKYGVNRKTIVSWIHNIKNGKSSRPRGGPKKKTEHQFWPDMKNL